MDSVNNFFQSSGRLLSNAMGNPTQQARAAFPAGNAWPQSWNYVGAQQTSTSPTLGPHNPAGFFPIDGQEAKSQFWMVLSQTPQPGNNIPYKTALLSSMPGVNSRTQGLANGSGGIPTSPISNSFLSPALPVGPYSTNRNSSGQTTQIAGHKNPNPSQGFTPLQYYQTVSPSWTGNDPQKNLKVFSANSILQTPSDKYKINKQDTNNWGDDRLSNFKYGLEDDINSTLLNYPHNQPDEGGIFKQIRSYNYQPNFDNEDPVFFSFEVEIDILNSPLFNGEAEAFINSMKNNSEVSSRLSLLKEFQKEISRYFRFNANLQNTNTGTSVNSAIFKTDPKKRYYYVNKVTGLHKLNESNTSGKQNAFTDYRNDTITITFFEDTTLNLGTLYSIYKLLYWSRLNGKNLIPENLLRFDCRVIVTEMRDYVQARKTYQSGNSGLFMQILKSNLSRYVYNLYECQLFFDKPSHPDVVDIGSSPSPTNTYDINFNFKYSNMIFERYSPNIVNGATSSFVDNGSYKILTNRDGYVENAVLKHNPLQQSFKEYALSTKSTTILDEFTDKESKHPGWIANQNSTSPPTGTANAYRNFQNTNLKAIYQSAQVTPQTHSNPNVWGQAGKNLFNGLKKAVLYEAQSHINKPFAMLNIALDKIRNSYGVGRIPAPSNVYNPPAGSTTGGLHNSFFFDVQNSLRNFGGDLLTGALGVAASAAFSQIPLNNRPNQPLYNNPTGQTSLSSGQDYTTLRFPGYSPAGQTDYVSALGVVTANGDMSMNTGFPSSAQKFPAPFVMGPQPHDLAALLTAQYGTPDINKIGFPSWAQKYPPPIT